MKPGIILDPNASDVEHALDEIVGIMRKYGFVMGCHPVHGQSIVLGRVSDGVGNEAYPVAEIRQIRPSSVDWRPIESQKPLVMQ